MPECGRTWSPRIRLWIFVHKSHGTERHKPGTTLPDRLGSDHKRLSSFRNYGGELSIWAAKVRWRTAERAQSFGANTHVRRRTDIRWSSVAQERGRIMHAPYANNKTFIDVNVCRKAALIESFAADCYNLEGASDLCAVRMVAYPCSVIGATRTAPSRSQDSTVRHHCTVIGVVGNPFATMTQGR